VILIVDPKTFDPNLTLFNAVAEDFGPGRLTYRHTLETNRDGIPYINNWFKSAVLSAPMTTLTIINADILLPSGWIDTITKILDVFGETAFVTGYRLNFDLKTSTIRELLDMKSHKNVDYDTLVHSYNYKPYGMRGMDFFTFLNHPGTKFFELFPPFLMGKYEWDNWVMGKMRQKHQTITLGSNFRVYHWNHPSTANKRWSPYSLYNKRLRVLYYSSTSDNEHTKWRLKDQSKLVGDHGDVIYL
jgi:hypothetical protein